MLEEANKNNKNPSSIRIIINSHSKVWGKAGNYTFMSKNYYYSSHKVNFDNPILP